MLGPEFAPEELTARGQLAVDYADLDYFLTHCAAMLLRCADAEVAWETIAPMQFSRKCEKVELLLKHYQKKHRVLPEPAFDELLRIVRRCKKTGEERNKIMHAHILLEGADWRPVFRHPKTGDEVDAAPAAVSGLASEMSSLAKECFISVDGFLFVLGRLEA